MNWRQLRKEGYVTNHVAHVPSIKKARKIVLLTKKGRDRVAKLKKRLEDEELAQKETIKGSLASLP